MFGVIAVAVVPIKIVESNSKTIDRSYAEGQKVDAWLRDAEARIHDKTGIRSQLSVTGPEMTATEVRERVREHNTRMSKALSKIW